MNRFFLIGLWVLACSRMASAATVIDDFVNGNVSLGSQLGSTQIASKQNLADVFSGQREVAFGTYAKGSIATIGVRDGSLFLDSDSASEQLKVAYSGLASTVDLRGKEIAVDFGYFRREQNQTSPFRLGVLVSSDPNGFNESNTSYTNFTFPSSNDAFTALFNPLELPGSADLSRINRIEIFVNDVNQGGVGLELKSIYLADVPEPELGLAGCFLFTLFRRRRCI